MRDYVNELGDTLLKLCKLSRQHNVDIRIRQAPGDLTGERFELRLDRGDHHAVETVDISPVSKNISEQLFGVRLQSC